MPREWCRGIQWASDKHRTAWEPILRRAYAAWSELELLTVSEGLRPGALVYLEPKELATATRDAARVGLVVTPVSSEWNQIRCAICRPEHREAWFAAYDSNDNALLAKLLGYPECCSAFFDRVWKNGLDPTAAMAAHNGPWVTNMFLRQIGVRLVPHLPCSGTCSETVALAEATVQVALRHGVDIPPIEALLRLPMKWDGLNGVALIETPPFRVMASSDVKGDRVVKERTGLTQLPMMRSFEANGFASEAAMRAAHDVLLAVAGETRSALDLGCGDGTLLARLAAGREGRWIGVEADGDRAAQGAIRYPNLKMWVGKIEELPRTETGEPVELAFLMPGRLLEMDAVTRSAVKEKLDQIAGRIIAYTYGDHGPLDTLCKDAGLALASPITANGSYQAAQVTVC